MIMSSLPPSAPQSLGTTKLMHNLEAFSTFIQVMVCKELHRDFKVETFIKLEKPSKVSTNLTDPSSLNASKIELNNTTPAISIH